LSNFYLTYINTNFGFYLYRFFFSPFFRNNYLINRKNLNNHSLESQELLDCNLLLSFLANKLNNISVEASKSIISEYLVIIEIKNSNKLKEK